ncbi:hypothetical protein [Aureispira anguillae]|uniref:Uncharacterized protein n=1 Tax=Aureispira anguillae TaxID=2864201 RepID=A0A915YJR4_9BACT|nr:hypothetical protein [Aureispira anguillae]BDS14340.1 hypothetical protein AsAng_0051190 [Aureispira anguillae]
MKKVILPILLCIISTLVYIVITLAKEPPHIVYKYVYKDIKSPNVIEDSILQKYRSRFPITEYDYWEKSSKLISDWKNRLPQDIRDSLRYKKMMIQKTYYLSDIQLKNEDKVIAIQKFDRALEESLSRRIGRVQGIPSVMFTTSIEDLQSKEEEYFVVQINRLMY